MVECLRFAAAMVSRRCERLTRGHEMTHRLLRMMVGFASSALCFATHRLCPGSLSLATMRQVIQLGHAISPCVLCVRRLAPRGPMHTRDKDVAKPVKRGTLPSIDGGYHRQGNRVGADVLYHISPTDGASVWRRSARLTSNSAASRPTARSAAAQRKASTVALM